MKIGKRLLYVIMLFAGINLQAQNPFFQHFTVLEGMPSNCVHKVYQDSKKFIWFSTDAGVTRYDGSKFFNFRKQDGLSSNEIVNIEEDSFGRIWLFHKNGTLNFIKNETVFNEINAPFLDSLKTHKYFHRLYEDPEHNIYFYFNEDLLIYSIDTLNCVKRYKLPSTPIKSNFRPYKSQGMHVRSMKKNADGEFILWATGGIYKTKDLSKRAVLINDTIRFNNVIGSSKGKKYAIVYEKEGTKYSLVKFNDETVFNKTIAVTSEFSDNINSVLEDSNGYLWISTYNKGVFCYQGSKLVYHFNIQDTKTVMEDHDRNVWINSVKEGVYKINPYFNVHQHFGDTFFQNSGIFALSKSDNTGVWCTNGKKIYLLKDNVIYESDDFQQTDKTFNQIVQVNQSTLLVGEAGKLPYSLEGFRINQAQKTIHFEKVSRSPVVLNKIIFNEPKKEIRSFKVTWLALMPPDKFFTKIKYIPVKEPVYNIYYNAKNELIINAKKSYIYQDSTMTEYKVLSSFNDKIISGHHNLTDETELFNIEGDSLFLLKDKQLYNLSAAFDQPVSLLIKHVAYHDSTLYFATSRNIYACKKPLNILKGEQLSLNLININFKSIHSILFVNEKLHVASDDGLDVIPSQYLQDTKSNPPVPYFQSIQVNDEKNMVREDHISLISGNRINITFGCINYSAFPVIYSYKLEGSDSEWITTKGNNVVLQSLNRGTYSFKLRARKSSSEWSEPIEFGIIVKATLWQHPLFYFFVSLFIAGIVFLVVLRRKNMELNRRHIEHQMILLEQKSLQAMMNPHFIFNSIGSIQNYLLHNKPDEAGIYLSQFARLIRQNLNAINASMVNLEEEVDRLKNYMDLEKLRMEDKFDYHIEIDEEVESEYVLIPSMIIQPFVENSIWHGIANLEKQGIIGISFLLQDEKSLQITIEDTGIGLKNAEKFRTGDNQHLKLGMNITRKRLELLSQKYGIEAGFEYSEKFPGTPNPGTKVVIIVPLLFGKSEINQDI